MVYQACNRVYLLWPHCDVSTYIFALLCAPNVTFSSIAVVLGICLPRVPSFALSNSTPLANATGDWRNAVTAQFSRVPANFSFPAFADLQVNTDSNYLPVNFKHLRAKVYDLDTGFLIGSGDLGHKVLPAKSFPNIQLPLNFTYVATNDSDTTCTCPLVS